MGRLLAIDITSAFLGAAALTLSVRVRYMFAAFLVITVCGFAFGARAGILATRRWGRVWVVAGSIVMWLVSVWAAGVWWLNKYGS